MPEAIIAILLALVATLFFFPEEMPSCHVSSRHIDCCLTPWLRCCGLAHPRVRLVIHGGGGCGVGGNGVGG